VSFTDAEAAVVAVHVHNAQFYSLTRQLARLHLLHGLQSSWQYLLPTLEHTIYIQTEGWGSYRVAGIQSDAELGTAGKHIASMAHHPDTVIWRAVWVVDLDITQAVSILDRCMQVGRSCVVATCYKQL
jgi:hypothetical protein